MFQLFNFKTFMLIISMTLLGVQWIQGPIMIDKIEFKSMDAISIVAHRGASAYAPENTLSAFEKAVAMGADYIEVDIQCSLDQKLIVFHDTEVDRTTDGYGEVKSMTLSALKQLDAGSYYHAKFSNEAIPTLDEVIDKFAGKVGILIDLKEPAQCPGIDQLLADFLIEKQLDRSEPHELLIQSFDTEVLRSIKKALPSVSVGVLIKRSQGQPSDAQLQEYADYADYINPHHRLVSSELVERVHSHGMKVIPWTVKHKFHAARMMAAKVDGMITDYPDLEFN